MSWIVLVLIILAVAVSAMGLVAMALFVGREPQVSGNSTLVLRVGGDLQEEALGAGPLQPHAAVSTPLAGAEVVLSSDEPEAVEADYRVIRALEREGLYRGGRP